MEAGPLLLIDRTVLQILRYLIRSLTNPTLLGISNTPAASQSAFITGKYGKYTPQSTCDNLKS
jgi:hypothetical protein